MSYTPINWQTGDTITADKLNKMDNGWSVSNGLTTIYNGSKTTDGDYLQIHTSASIYNVSNITVTLDNTVYNLTGFDDDGWWTFGAPYGDFSDYPFSIYQDVNGGQFIITEQAGTYALKIEANVETIEVSDGFKKAVGKVGQPPLLLISGVTTSEEMGQALSDGRLMYFQTQSSSYYFVTVYNGINVGFIPEANRVIAEIVDGVFVVAED